MLLFFFWFFNYSFNICFNGDFGNSFIHNFFSSLFHWFFCRSAFCVFLLSGSFYFLAVCFSDFFGSLGFVWLNVDCFFGFDNRFSLLFWCLLYSVVGSCKHLLVSGFIDRHSESFFLFDIGLFNCCFALCIYNGLLVKNIVDQSFFFY